MSIEVKQYNHKTGVTEPGVYEIPMDVYHLNPVADGYSVSSSGLRTIISQSLRHYWDASYLNPDQEEDEQSPYMILGRAAHHLLLGESGFSKKFALQPEEAPDSKGVVGPWHGSKTFCKKWVAARAEEGRAVITPEMFKNIKGMAKGLGANPHVQQGMLNGLVEKSFFWRDKETGLWLKIRPDAVPLADGISVDLKVVTDASRIGVQRSLSDTNLHIQAALVGMGFEEVLGWPRNDANHWLFFLESKRPHCCVPQQIDERAIYYARCEIRATLRKLAEAHAKNEWPGYEDRVGDTLYLPKWRVADYEERMKLGLLADEGARAA
jgi:hypothetical protein